VSPSEDIRVGSQATVLPNLAAAWLLSDPVRAVVAASAAIDPARPPDALGIPIDCCAIAGMQLAAISSS